MKKRIIILGSTGSIGSRVLDVAADFPEHFEVVALSAHSRLDLLARQVGLHHPRAVCVCDPAKAADARALCESAGVRAHMGTKGLEELVAEYDADLVIVATVGFVGIAPSLRALASGKALALANKEVLVAAGDIVMEAARRAGRPILPIDSEHNAIAQCLNNSDRAALRRIILTASGGPFRGASRDDMKNITPAEALRHPTWNMGPKITIDSATLMNKGFEVIEGAHLFGVSAGMIQVVIHPQSVIHSMVEYVDGSVIAQLGVTDMYLPIQNALFHPERVANRFAPLDFARLGMLTFENPDMETFPCLRFAYEAASRGGTYPAVLNAANETAVARFLAGGMPFLAIADTIRGALEDHKPSGGCTLDDILAADRWARERAGRP
ncbi:MAG: 1-deoxy-D-xylulose-5-phosphate reductoisomerase [bacterium]|nr:1-deoxy-D-xylulose-5-phosphate reductoisomerase [Candidatus Sumerlaeota bacterium]